MYSCTPVLGKILHMYVWTFLQVYNLINSPASRLCDGMGWDQLILDYVGRISILTLKWSFRLKFHFICKFTDGGNVYIFSVRFRESTGRFYIESHNIYMKLLWGKVQFYLIFCFNTSIKLYKCDFCYSHTICMIYTYTRVLILNSRRIEENSYLPSMKALLVLEMTSRQLSESYKYSNVWVYSGHLRCLLISAKSR